MNIQPHYYFLIDNAAPFGTLSMSPVIILWNETATKEILFRFFFWIAQLYFVQNSKFWFNARFGS